MICGAGKRIDGNVITCHRRSRYRYQVWEPVNVNRDLRRSVDFSIVSELVQMLNGILLRLHRWLDFLGSF